MRVILGLTVVGAIGLLGLALWPGVLELVVFSFPFVFVSLPLLGVWFLLLVGLGLRDLAGRSASAPRHRWLGMASASIMFGTIGLLWGHFPQRVAFAFCSEQFKEMVDPQDERCGPYKVNRFAADPRGGLFFQTASGPDGLGPDEFSYGFAFRPNGEGTPFGNARYRQRRLFDDWYSFAASNDW